MKVNKAEFVKSATHPRDFPPTALPEIAFAGRSNVGKSSLINALCERKSLVKTSGKPGHTRTLNFFQINDELMFTDLPGYGYAKVSKSERNSWGKMVETYLAERETLRGVVCIVDVRRGFEQDDLMIVEAAPHFAYQPIIVLTKADKLTRNQRYTTRHKMAKEMSWSPEEMILFSSTEDLGREELWDRIVQLTGIEG